MKDKKEKVSELTEQEKSELKVEWLGVDGALVLLYIVLACIYGYGMLNSVDFIIGIMAPGIAILITVGVFLKYCCLLYTSSPTYPTAAISPMDRQVMTMTIAPKTAANFP